MTDLEDRIREALKDPSRQIPAWPDPMPRIRRAARKQRSAVITLTAAVAAAIVTPLALLPGLAAHRAGPPGHGRTTHGIPSLAVSGLLAGPGSWSGPVPPWAKRLGGEVTYNCGNYLCVMHPDGSADRTLMASHYAEWDPAWSPNGRDLTFRGYYGPGDGQYDLYLADVAGCRLTRLTRQLNGTSSSWSPNGQQIVFSVPLGIYVINADGSGLRRLMAGESADAYGVDTPAWSASNRIAYARYLPQQRRTEIDTMNPDGSGKASLTQGAPGFGQPSWSPNGNSIAFVANAGSASGIEVATPDGSGVHRVSPRSWNSYSPTWTPGGKIVFLRQTGSPRQTTGAPTSAYIVNPDGSGLRLLYSNLDASQISWGPATLPGDTCMS